MAKNPREEVTPAEDQLVDPFSGPDLSLDPADLSLDDVLEPEGAPVAEADFQPSEFVKAWRREGIPQLAKGTGAGLELVAQQMEAPPSVGDVEDPMALPVAAEAPRGEMGMALGGAFERVAEKITPKLKEWGSDIKSWAKEEADIAAKKFPKDPRIEGMPWTEALKSPETGALYLQSALGANLPILAGGVGSSLVGGIVAGPAGAITAGGAFMYLQEGGHSYDELREMGVSDANAAEVASAVGVVNALLEGSGVANLYRVVPGLRRLMTKQLVNQAKNKTWREALRRGGEQALVEGSTEALQEIVANVGKQVFNENQEILEGVGESAFIGALIGKTTGFAPNVPLQLTRAEDRKTLENRLDELQDRAEELRKQKEDRRKELQGEAEASIRADVAEEVEIKSSGRLSPEAKAGDIHPLLEDPSDRIELSREGVVSEREGRTELFPEDEEALGELDETLEDTVYAADEIYVDLQQQEQQVMAELQDTLGQIEAVDLSEQEDEAVLIDPYETEVTELPAAEGIAEEAALVEGEPGTPSEFEPQPGISTRGLELPYGRGFEDMVLEPELLEEAAPVQPELDLGTKEAPKKKAPTKARRKKKAAYFEKVGVGDKVAALQEAEKAFVKALGKERQESLFASVYGGKEMSRIERATAAFGKVMGPEVAEGRLTKDMFFNQLANLSAAKGLFSIREQLWTEITKEAAIYEPLPDNWVLPTAEEAKRLYTALGAKRGKAGQLKNRRKVLRGGGKRFVVGIPTMRDWVNRVENVLTSPEIDRAASWYKDVADAFSVIEDKALRELVIKGWLMSNKNVTPQGALHNVLRVREQLISKAEGLKGGMSDQLLRDWVTAGKVEGLEGIGVKLADFVDSAMGRTVRTFMGNTGLAGDPAVIDVHSARDMGWVDPAHLKRLKAVLGEEAVKDVRLDVATSEEANEGAAGGVTPQLYETLAQRLRDIAGELNKASWRGRSNWTPSEVQAIGWQTMVKWSQAVHGGYDSFGSVEYVKAQMLAEVTPSTSHKGLSVLEASKEYKKLPFKRQMQVQQEIMDQVAKYADSMLGTITTRVDTAPGNWQGEVNPSSNLHVLSSNEARGEYAQLLSYLLKQDLVIGLRFNPPKTYRDGIAIAIRTDMDSQRAMTAVWDSLKGFEIPQKLAKKLSITFEQEVKNLGDLGLSMAEVDGQQAIVMNIPKPAGISLDSLYEMVPEWFQKDVGPNLNLNFDVEIDLVPTGAEYGSNKWAEDPNGESILQSFSERYPEDWVKQLRSDGANFVEEALKRALAGEAQPTISPGREAVRQAYSGLNDRDQQSLNAKTFADKVLAQGKPVVSRGKVAALNSAYELHENAGLTRARAIEILKRHFNAEIIDRMIEAGILDMPVTRLTKDQMGAVTPSTGVITLHLANMTEDQIVTIFLHEAGAHFGLPAMLGGQYRQIIRRLIRLYTQRNPHVVAAFDYVERLRKVGKQPPQFIWDEVLAYSITHPELGKFPTIRRAVMRIRKWLRDTLGIQMELSLDEIREMAHFAIHQMPNMIKNEQRRAKHIDNVRRTLGYNPTFVGATSLPTHKPRPKGWDVTLSSTAVEQEFDRDLRDRRDTNLQKGIKFLRRGLAPGGLLPRMVFNEDILRQGNFEAEELKAKHVVKSYEKAVKSSYGRSVHNLPESEASILNSALAGNERALDALKAKPELYEAIGAMRAHIDQLSSGYIEAVKDQMQMERERIEAKSGRPLAQLLQEGAAIAERYVAQHNLVTTILGNEGEYVHRSYKAFDDPNWPKKVPDETVANALAYLEDRANSLADSMEREAREALMENPGHKGAKKKLDSAQEIRANAKRQSKHIVTDILKNGTKYDNAHDYIRETKLGAKDLRVLMRRKDIAPEIRALMGEIKEPRLNYVKSVTKMSRLVFNHQFLKSIKEKGIGTIFFREDDVDRPTWAHKPLAEAHDEKMWPLNGLVSSKEVVDAMVDAATKEHYSGFIRNWIKMNGMVKFGKTVLSPTTAFRNFMSAGFFAMANGHFNPAAMRHGFKTMRSYFAHGGSQAVLEYMQKMKRLGVIFDTAHATEMMKLLEDSNLEDWLAAQGVARRTVQKGRDFAQAFYTYGDDFWKIMGFEQEIAMLKRHGMSHEEAEVQAAERIRNTYPTYSMTGKWVQALRRFPLLGTFVSFPAEIIRTSYHIARYTAEDFKAGRNEMWARRGVGLAATASLTQLAAAWSRDFFDIDDDEEEAIRFMAPPWQTNSTYFYIGRDDERNTPMYIDLSFLDPYNYWKRPWTAIMRNAPWEDKWKAAVSDIITPFFGADITTGAFLEVFGAGGGKPVMKPGDDWDDMALKGGAHMAKAMAPGAISWGTRMGKAMGLTDQAIEGGGAVSPSGKKFRVDHELAGFFGWRVSEFVPQTALRYRGIEFSFARSAAKQRINEVIRNPNVIKDKELFDAYEKAKVYQEAAYDRLVKSINAIRKSGVSDSRIRSWLNNLSSVAKKEIPYLMRGETPPFKLSSSSLNESVKKARALYGDETVKVFRDRHRKLTRYIRERKK
jgi:hypothetical protein